MKSRHSCRILFLALAQSTHTHAWVRLLRDTEFKVRVFGLQEFGPPADFEFPTYWFNRSFPSLNPSVFFPFSQKKDLSQFVSRRLGQDNGWMEQRWLVAILRKWKPQIVHSLGLDPAACFFSDVLPLIKDPYGFKWVVTARGGPEMALQRRLPEFSKKIAKVLAECHYFIADNELNYEYAVQLGLHPSKIAPFGSVPGTGGVWTPDDPRFLNAPSKRQRLIVWPKGYECPASKALPVLEALKIAWNRIKPCEVIVTAVTPEVRMWVRDLPTEIQASIHLLDRVSRPDLLNLMKNARIMLAPSLTDGVPNTLYEAMAAGTFPIVSPLDTIKAICQDQFNALFARNLYPNEIAGAIVKGMEDDKLIDSAVVPNLELVKRMADRAKIKRQIVDFYGGIID